MAEQLSAPNTSISPGNNPFRADGRRPDQLRPVQFRNRIAPYATGSTLIEWGNTRVICGVTVEETVPRWMKEQNVSGGWITAEYSMLPYSTQQRKQRDISKGKIDGRSQEIQRLIGRAMRAAADLENFLLRADDVRAVLDQLDQWNKTSNNPLSGRLDMNRIGMSGHSFGAVTTQALSGQRFVRGAELSDARIKAAHSAVTAAA